MTAIAYSRWQRDFVNRRGGLKKTLKFVCVSHRQARSQDLEKGGLFWKSEKSANDLDPNFHCSWISFTRFVRKLRRNFSESGKFKRFFRPNTGGLQKKKKKKGLRRNWVWFFGQIRKFKQFFSPKTGGLQKIKIKKRRSLPKLSLIFRPKSHI